MDLLTYLLNLVQVCSFYCKIFMGPTFSRHTAKYCKYCTCSDINSCTKQDDGAKWHRNKVELTLRRHQKIIQRRDRITESARTYTTANISSPHWQTIGLLLTSL